MSEREIWDAYGSNGNKLGYDLYRDESSLIPEGVYHIVAEVYTITRDKEVLVTQRHPDKPWPLKWEITGGSVLKGETPIKETGILTQESDLRFVYSYLMKGMPAIYYCYMIVINRNNTEIKLQRGETIDYRYISYDRFKELIQTEKFVDTIRARFNVHEELFDNIVSSI